MSKPTLSCFDFAKAGIWDQQQCCPSCHGDEDYGYDLLWRNSPLPQVEGAEVCCTFRDDLTPEDWQLALEAYREVLGSEEDTCTGQP